MRPNGFKIDFMGTPISGSAEYLFVIDLKLIFKLIFKYNISEKKLGMKII